MGLSVVSATLIIVVTLSYTGAQAGTAILTGTSQVELARSTQRARHIDIDHSFVDVTTVTWTGFILRTSTINVVNTGTTTYNVSKTNVLLEGLLKDADVTSLTIGGVTAKIWLPGETLVIVVSNVATSPAFVTVVASNGARDYWRPA